MGASDLIRDRDPGRMNINPAQDILLPAVPRGITRGLVPLGHLEDPLHKEGSPHRGILPPEGILSLAAPQGHTRGVLLHDRAAGLIHKEGSPHREVHPHGASEAPPALEQVAPHPRVLEENKSLFGAEIFF